MAAGGRRRGREPVFRSQPGDTPVVGGWEVCVSLPLCRVLLFFFPVYYLPRGCMLIMEKSEVLPDSCLTHRRLPRAPTSGAHVCLETCVLSAQPTGRKMVKKKTQTVCLSGSLLLYISALQDLTGYCVFSGSFVGFKVGILHSRWRNPAFNITPSCQRLSKTTFPNFWLLKLHSSGLHVRRPFHTIFFPVLNSSVIHLI